MCAAEQYPLEVRDNQSSQGVRAYVLKGNTGFQFVCTKGQAIFPLVQGCKVPTFFILVPYVAAFLNESFSIRV